MPNAGKLSATIALLSAIVFVTQMASAGDVFNMPVGLTSLEMVFVGNAGNVADTEIMVECGTAGYGSVDYTYDIGKYEVTMAQYTVFLNAVAATDAYGLYSTNTSNRIQRAGMVGSYAYSVAADWANRPVNYISWGDTVRFSNWLHNGQPTGLQDATTTEDGSYALYGAMTHAELMAITRESVATWVLPTEDEWYKAAYYDGDAGVYYDGAAGTNDRMSNALIDPDPGNNGNFYDSIFTIGLPYLVTEVGEFENSISPYGTVDQAGNLSEWNEGIAERSFGDYRSMRGGSYGYTGTYSSSHAYSRGRFWASPESSSFESRLGFRVAQVVPEPLTLSLLGLGVSGLLMKRRNA